VSGKVGRSRKYSFEKVKSIINLCNKHSGMKTHMAASTVERFAQDVLKMGDFRAYHITRHEECKKYLDQANDKIESTRSNEITKPVSFFHPIDIESYVSMTPKQLSKALYNLNVLLEDSSDKYLESIKENLLLEEKWLAIEKEFSEYKCDMESKISKLKNKITSLKGKNSKIRQDYFELDSIIKILWDKEAENVLIELGVFEGRESTINEKATIMDTSTNIVSLVSDDIKEIESGSEKSLEDTRANFLESLGRE